MQSQASAGARVSGIDPRRGRRPLELFEPRVSRGLVQRLRLAPLLGRFPERLVWAAFMFVNGFLTIGLLALVAMLSGTAFIFPSLGPTAFLVFFTPNAPSASPRHTLLGHGIGILCGVGALWLCGLQHAGPALQTGVTGARVLAAALSLAATGALMILFKCAHPPAGATTLIISLGLVTRPGPLLVIEIAVAVLALQAIAINRLAGLDYPLWAKRGGGDGGPRGGSGGSLGAEIGGGTVAGGPIGGGKDADALGGGAAGSRPVAGGDGGAALGGAVGGGKDADALGGGAPLMHRADGTGGAGADRDPPGPHGGGPRRPELPAMALAIVASALLALLIYLGSRRFRDFDSALIGYAIGTVVALAAIVYRYSLWITRPPTWRYFRGGWRNFLSLKNFRRYALFIPVTLWREIFAQTFILERSFTRWLMHMCLFWGVIFSLCITLPLTFGWIHFNLVPPGGYQLFVIGIPVLRFPIESGLGFWLFHALDVTAFIVMVGVTLALMRRYRDMGQLTSQRFAYDLLPLVLLAAICITGLLLTASSLWWAGRYYGFISLTHQLVVVAWLLWIPFGKFFHIVQRPASVGVRLYQLVNQNLEGQGVPSPAACRGCGTAMPSTQFVADVKGTLADLGQRYPLGETLGSLHDYCPTCKRRLRGKSYFGLLGRRFL